MRAPTWKTESPALWVVTLMALGLSVGIAVGHGRGNPTSQHKGGDAERALQPITPTLAQILSAATAISHGRMRASGGG